MISNENMNQILLVGAGNMAAEYAKILISQQIDFVCVGNSERGCEKFLHKTGVRAISGGIEKYLNNSTIEFTHAIVCSNVEFLGENTITLLQYGVPNILVEKPGSISFHELKNINNKSAEIGASVFIAYNRRFYASVQEAIRIIENDGGVLSFNFEFTEWGHQISKLDKPAIVKNAWLIANSSHVIDLAFFIGGKPESMNSWVGGKTTWHDGSAIYVGAGVSESGALFTYNANWIAPGRWGVEWLTAKHRIILKPLEELRIQEIGTVKISQMDIDNSNDCTYKPGLYSQVECFLEKRHECMVTIEQQLEMIQIYEKMRSGEPIK